MLLKLSGPFGEDLNSPTCLNKSFWIGNLKWKSVNRECTKSTTFILSIYKKCICNLNHNYHTWVDFIGGEKLGANHSKLNFREAFEA